MVNVGVAFFIELILTLLFCITLHFALVQVRPSNRKIPFWYIWILFIPYINIIWNFFVVIGLSNSVKAELEEREYEITGRPAFLSGIIYAIITVLMTVAMFSFPVLEVMQQVVKIRAKDTTSPLNTNEIILLILGIAGIVRMIFFFQFWVKVSWYKNVLKEDLVEE